MEELYCRCDGEDLGTGDHCPACGCEEFEESCDAQPYDRYTGDHVATTRHARNRQGVR